MVNYWMYTPDQFIKTPFWVNISIPDRTRRDKHCIRNVEYDGITRPCLSPCLLSSHSLYFYCTPFSFIIINENVRKKNSFWQQKIIIKNGNVITCHSSPAVILPKLQNINQIAFETLCRIFLYFHDMCYYDERNAFIL